MKLIYNSIFLEHDTGMHPENKDRLTSLGNVPETEIEIGEEYLDLVHKRDYVTRVKEFSKTGGQLDQDTIVSVQSYNCAVDAVGATVMASQSGDFALVRPPGHHAYPDHGSGFCLFNNVAIAVQKLVNEDKKVLVFDFDGHLGDGTSHCFYNSNKVLYWSIHQFPAFPGGGWVNEIGKGEGEGFTINVPLPAGSGDEIFNDAFNTFLPIAEEFNPSIVALSAGFDAHQYDPLLNLRLSANTYFKIGKIISSRFDNVFATLEGGYNIEILPRCITNFLNGFNNEEMGFVEEETKSSELVFAEYQKSKSLLQQNLFKYWKSI